MLTPQQIQDKKFEKAMFGGYDMGQVDEFLDEMLDDYTALYKENAALKAKMRVLVDKIEEYRAVDDEMRKALYAAQTSAKELVQKAEQQAETLRRDSEQQAQTLMREAEQQAREKIGGIRAEIDSEQRRLQQAQQLTQAYGQKIQGLLHKNLDELQTVLAERPMPDKHPAVAAAEQAIDELQVTPAAPDVATHIAEQIAEQAPVEPAVPAAVGAHEVPVVPQALPVDAAEVATEDIDFSDTIDLGKVREAAAVAPNTEVATEAFSMPEYDMSIEPEPEAEPAPAFVAPQQPEPVPVREPIVQPQTVESPTGMPTQFLAIDFGKPRAQAEPQSDSDDSDTGRIYGDSPFTPKPRFVFDDLQFGKNFSQEDEDE